jgi:hypothetical protein
VEVVKQVARTKQSLNSLNAPDVALEDGAIYKPRVPLLPAKLPPRRPVAQRAQTTSIVPASLYQPEVLYILCDLNSLLSF